MVNESRVDIELTSGPRPRLGLSLLGYTTDPTTIDGSIRTEGLTDPFPLRLHPGEHTDLTTVGRVTNCDAIRGIDSDDDRIDLQVRIADGPASWITP